MKKAMLLIAVFIFAIGLLVGCGGGGTSSPQTAILENVGDSNTGVGFGDNPFVNGTEILRYQTFIANSYSNLTQIELKIRRFQQSGTPEDLKVQLFRTDSNHQPAGTSLATTFITAESITNFNPQAFQIVLIDLPYSGLANGEEYAIVLSQKFPASDPTTLPHYEVCAGIKNQPWHFGQYKKTDSGYIWNDNSTNIGPAWIRIHLSNTISSPTTGTLYMGGTGKWGIMLSKDQKVAQVFTASAYPQMISVDLELRKIGTPTDITVGLYTVDSSGRPTTTRLAEGTISAASVGATHTAVNVPLSYSGLVNGTRYAIVLLAPTSPTAGDYYLPTYILDMPQSNASGFLERGYGWEACSPYSYKMVVHVAK